MNAIQGGIPPSLWELKQLKFVDFSNNNLSGELPKEFVKGCINLQVLELANNNLQGQVLPTNSNMSSLQYLGLANNRFSGELSRGLLNSVTLKLLDLSNNSITSEIPDWIGYLSQLRSIGLLNNFLQGPIPMSLCKVKELSFLDLSKNKFTETIPACLNVSSLRYLHLEGNEFTGFVPKVLSEASALVTLDMRNNNLIGRIPSWISSLSNLRFLLLGGNQLEGSIPPQLCYLKNVSMLDLSSNNLSSFLPSCLHKVLFGSKITFDVTVGSNLYGRVYHYPFSTYSYESQLQIGQRIELYHTTEDYEEHVEFVTKSRSELYKGKVLKYMSGINLSFNNFTGPIPHEMGYLSDIHTLNLSHNHFTGSIPTTFSNLKQIECLDLSHIRLNGQIPQDLIELNFLSIFSVAFNNLSGKIPDKNKFSTFVNSSYESNLRHPPPEVTEKRGKKAGERRKLHRRTPSSSLPPESSKLPLLMFTPEQRSEAMPSPSHSATLYRPDRQEYFTIAVKLNRSDIPREIQVGMDYRFVALRLDAPGLVYYSNNGPAIIDTGECYGYENKTHQSKGCQIMAPAHLQARGGGQTFEERSGFFFNNTRLGLTVPQSYTARDSTPSPSDCRENCGEDCD
nr:LRR receptor-like serine/threonine-protein kinase ERL2 [Ipomoea trifida]